MAKKVIPEQEIRLSKEQWNKLIKPPDSGQLYILPPKETLLVPDTGKFTRSHNIGVDAVYASAKPVDIEALAIYLWRLIDNLLAGETITQEDFKQAIEDYIKE